MVEIEGKILDVSHKDYEEKILALGGKRVFFGELKALFFSRDDDDLFDKRQKTLRLRQEGHRCFLTFKDKNVKSCPKGCDCNSKSLKIREEVEIEVDSFDKTKDMLEKLGYKVFATGTKIRVSYILDDVKLEFDDYIDEYSYIPELLEIEAPSQDKVKEYAVKLGFRAEDLSPWGFGRLIKHYKQ